MKTRVVGHEQWVATRKQHLAKEKEFTRLRDELHVLAPREAHHRRVLDEAVHEKRLHAPVACADMRTCQQRAADAPPAMGLEHGDAELGMAITARYMRHAEELESFVKHAKHRVVLEIDALDVCAHRMVA